MGTLGSSLGAQGRFLDDFGADLGTKWAPNGVQNDSKIVQKSTQFWGRFSTSIWEPKVTKMGAFFEQKETSKRSRRDSEPKIGDIEFDTINTYDFSKNPGVERLKNNIFEVWRPQKRYQNT